MIPLIKLYNSTPDVLVYTLYNTMYKFLDLKYKFLAAIQEQECEPISQLTMNANYSRTDGNCDNYYLMT